MFFYATKLGCLRLWNYQHKKLKKCWRDRIPSVFMYHILQDKIPFTVFWWSWFTKDVLYFIQSCLWCNWFLWKGVPFFFSFNRKATKISRLVILLCRNNCVEMMIGVLYAISYYRLEGGQKVCISFSLDCSKVSNTQVFGMLKISSKWYSSAFCCTINP